MDEHDKRAREVMEQLGIHAHTSVTDVIASALRSTAAGAVAAERERCAKVCDADAQTHDECADVLLARPSYEWTPQQRDAYETHRECSQAARNFATRIRTASPAAAQAERVSEGTIGQAHQVGDVVETLDGGEALVVGLLDDGRTVEVRPLATACWYRAYALRPILRRGGAA